MADDARLIVSCRPSFPMHMHERHNLAWLAAGGWHEAIEAARPECRDAIHRWQRENWPATVRRQDADVQTGQCSLGIALPPDPDSGLKRRMGLQVSQMHIARTSAPLALSEAVAAAPPQWIDALAALNKKATSVGVVLRVYGSLALQAVTGMGYLTPTSDIDLFFSPASRDQLAAVIPLLQQASTSLPLDGEIAFPGGQGVAWKEWSAAVLDQRNTRVLAKYINGVRLATPYELLVTLDEETWTA